MTQPNQSELPLEGIQVEVVLRYPEGWTRKYTITPVDEIALERTANSLLMDAIKQMQHDKEAEL